MISLPKHSWILAAGFLGCVACGDGGGGDAGDDGAGAVVRLAVATQFLEGDPQTVRDVVLRNVGDEWEAVDEVLGGDPFVVTDVAFVSADEVWAWGFFTAYRSDDGGRSWRQATFDLPAGFRNGTYGIDEIAFVDARTGYIAGSALGRPDAPAHGPFVWRTADGGRTWTEVDGFTTGPEGVFFAFDVRGGAGEILRGVAPDYALFVQRVDRAAGESQVLSRESTFPTDLTSVGDRGWAALNVYPPDGAGRTHAAIFRSESPGAPWVAQTLPEVSSDGFTLDFCDRDVGLAGGRLSRTDSDPVVFWTDDGGDHWQRTALDYPLLDSTADVECVTPNEMWLAAYAPRNALLRSADGGRTFDPVEIAVDGALSIYALASNAAFR